MPSNATSCGTNQECLAVGVAGQYACVNRKLKWGSRLLGPSVTIELMFNHTVANYSINSVL